MKKLFALFLLAFPAFGAANLAMSSATLAADGVTLTIPFTGTCQAPLSPASGILGFTVTVAGGWAGSISSATRAGCTVTLVISEPVSVDETPTITLAATTGANFLTDNAGNTPTGQSGFSVGVSGSEWHEVGGPSLSGLYRAEGAGGPGTPNYHSTYTFQLGFPSADGCYRINATATQLSLFAFNYLNDWVLRRDGATIHDWGATPNTATWSDQGLVTGLSGAHEYEFCSNNPQGNGPWLAIVARIRITGTIGAQPAAKTLIMTAGDSITAYYGPQPVTDSTLGDLYQIATPLGLADQYWGSPGDQLCANMQTEIPTQIGYQGATVPVLFLAGSTDYNDFVAGTSAAAVGTCMNTLLTALDGLSNPPTHIIVGGNLPFVSPIPGTYDTAIAAAVALHPRACFAPRLTWINTVAWTGSTGDRQSDQLHIEGNDDGNGYWKMANRELPITAGYLSGASFSAPSASGTSSATITLTLPGAATWVSGLTATSSNASDTLSFAGGTPANHAVTLSAPPGTNTVALTVSGTAGSRTITYSSPAECWTVATPTSVTITAAVNTSTYIIMGDL